jgi:hypothetical protein
MPGLGGGTAVKPVFSVLMFKGLFMARMLSEKLLVVGVAGSTLTEVCGLRLPNFMLEEPVGDAREAEAEDVDEALEILC